MKRVAAHAVAVGHVVDVLLIQGKEPAVLGAAFAVHPAQMVPGQHRAGDGEMAACPALAAVPWRFRSCRATESLRKRPAKSRLTLPIKIRDSCLIVAMGVP